MKRTPLIFLLPIFLAMLSAQTFARSTLLYPGCTLAGNVMTCSTKLTFAPTNSTHALTCDNGWVADATQTGTVSCSNGLPISLSCPNGVQQIIIQKPRSSIENVFYKEYCNDASDFSGSCYAKESKGPYTCFQE